MSGAEFEQPVDEGVLSEDDFHERVRRNQHIQDTAASEGWAHIAELANEARSALQHKLAFGGCKDFDEYQKTWAEFKGITFVLDIPRITGRNVDALREMREADREDPA